MNKIFRFRMEQNVDLDTELLNDLEEILANM